MEADGLLPIRPESVHRSYHLHPASTGSFRVLFQSSDILSAATVDSIAVEVSPALADSVVGEVWPQDAVIGQATELTYWVRSYNSSGFDQLDIKTQAPVEVIRSVQIDGTDVAWDKEDTEEEDGDIVGVRISFPRITGDDRLLRVVFESIALHYKHRLRRQGLRYPETAEPAADARPGRRGR